MKKIIATLTAIAAAMTLGAFAEKYVSANDLELGTVAEDKALEDDFVIKATAEKIVEITKQSSDCPNSVGDETFTQRIKIGGKGDVTCRSIQFPAKAGQKVTVYAKSSSKTDNRIVAVLAEDGTQVGTSEAAAYAGEISVGSVTLPADGNYFVTSGKSGIYIYEIIVE
ncbi:MAG: hypothetical protein SOT81_10775 [Treponema sp.]|nr:hypothetical protein [Treponema sp.]